MDLGAPGVDIMSTFRGQRYKYESGTSMACPMVAGTAAMLLNAWAEAGGNMVGQSQLLKHYLLAGVDPVPSLSGATVTGRAMVHCSVLTGLSWCCRAFQEYLWI